MNRKKRILGTAAALAAMLLVLTMLAGCSGGSKKGYTDIAVLTTTDMHGKCWEKDLVSDAPLKANMLRVSSAVDQIRKKYGKENVILLDDGDVFQGTIISQQQLTGDQLWDDSMPPAMAVCLKEIGYDAMTLGNHEFDFRWDAMKKTYSYLEDNGIAVLGANVVYSEAEDGHDKGENAFTPYIIRTITVNGHEHKIGILGLDNTDVPDWDPPENYPGLQFYHPENEDRDIAAEAELYLPQMKKEGCEFIIAEYHAGLGDTADASNTEHQGRNLIKNTGDIDMVVLGHDHSSGSSNTYETNRDGKKILIVAGGGQQLTQSIFRFKENSSGDLEYEIVSTENLDLSGYEPDSRLEKLIRPYAEQTDKEVNKPIGTASGEWDGKTDWFTEQTDTEDFSLKAVSSMVSELSKKDVDLSIMTCSVRENYAIQAGELTMKDMYKVNEYQNSVILLSLSGSKIRDIMEEDAAERYSCRVIDGVPHYYTKGEYYTALFFGNLNFSIDMSKPEGERVIIEGFADGRSFDDNESYYVATCSYLLSNDNCGLRDITMDDAVWAQSDNDPAGVVQDLYAEFAAKASQDGGLTPELFDWKWELTYSADPKHADSGEGATAAMYEKVPEDGSTYILYQESEGLTLTDEKENEGLGTVGIDASGNRLTGQIPAEARRFTVRKTDKGSLLLIDQDGRYLTIDENKGIHLTKKKADGSLSEWKLRETDGGYVLASVGYKGTGDQEAALQFYGTRFTTFEYLNRGNFVFNFYRVAD